MRHSLRLAFLAPALCLGSAVGQDPAADDASDDQRLAGHWNAFGQRLAETVAKPDANCCLSPASIAIALLMSWPGARGETEQELATLLLPPDLPAERRLPALARLVAAYAGPTSKIQLAMANDVWPQQGLALLPDYRASIERTFQSLVRPVDFAGNPVAARKTINDHIARATKDRIQDLLPAELITPDTVLILTNAVYFLGKWQQQFSPEKTGDGRFTGASGERTLKFLRDERTCPYAEVAGTQVLRLLYENANFAMDLALPAQGRPVAEAEHLLAGKTVALLPTTLGIAMPRFRIEGAFELKPALQQLGLRLAMTPAADFRGIVAERIWIQEVVHKTFLDVAEKGTEAAAATAVAMVRSAAPMPPATQFVADRPFAFALRDLRTGLVLFQGRVCDPVAK
jgi:serpin B